MQQRRTSPSPLNSSSSSPSSAGSISPISNSTSPRKSSTFRKKPSTTWFLVVVLAVCVCASFNILHETLAKKSRLANLVNMRDEMAAELGGQLLLSELNKKKLTKKEKKKKKAEAMNEWGGGSEEEPDVDNLEKNKLAKKKKEKKTKTGVKLVKMDEHTTSSHDKQQHVDQDEHKIAGLSCAAHGGPSDEIASEMVYWRDIPSDATYVSPFKRDAMNKNVTRYLTFESDEGGWNNIRMSMETVLVMAAAMGRTLVLPPELEMYLLGKKKKQQKHHFSFSDFFHLESLAREHDGFDIITMKEYLEREAMSGNIKNKKGKPVYPPNRRTDWDGNDEEAKELFSYLRSNTHVLKHWDPEECLAAFPASLKQKDITYLEDIMTNISTSTERKKNGSFKYPKKAKPYDWPTFVGNPVPVNAPPLQRLAENYNERLELCVYDKTAREAHTVHFMVDIDDGPRLLTHFYSFVFFQDWTQDTWAKRFVRDHVRYKDELTCAAARVVHAVRQRARANPKTDVEDEEFDSFHIRRGDFQYKDTRVSADDILSASKDVLRKGSTIYIASDERKKSFFEPLAERYDVCYLDDFKHLFPDLNTNYYGMLDQLVASRGRHFVGTYLSTFTGYINRMRGYHSTKNKLKGYKDGIIDSWYFVPEDKKDDMRTYHPLHHEFWAREFPTAWRDIDRGIKELGKKRTGPTVVRDK